MPASQAPLYELGSLVPIHISDGKQVSGDTTAKKEVSLCDVYELDKQPLGRGSYGEVWGATHRQTGARRAVKSVDKMIVAKTRSDFLRRELDILRQLDHPNILRLYEAFEDHDAIFLVLELCEGGDLLERVAAPHDQMPEREAAVLLMQMLGAIQHLHLHGVIHRDVKPENFLFTRREPEREPLPPEVGPMKLIDFGLSRRLSRESGVTMTPKIGTTEYMAPEAFNGQVAEKQADRIDMWSLGVVLHTMLTGHFPSPRLAKEPPTEYLSTPYWNRFSAGVRDLLAS
jgi:calcium-dependent protein kinase